MVLPLVPVMPVNSTRSSGLRIEIPRRGGQRRAGRAPLRSMARPANPAGRGNSLTTAQRTSRHRLLANWRPSTRDPGNAKNKKSFPTRRESYSRPATSSAGQLRRKRSAERHAGQHLAERHRRELNLHHVRARTESAVPGGGSWLRARPSRLHFHRQPGGRRFLQHRAQRHPAEDPAPSGPPGVSALRSKKAAGPTSRDVSAEAEASAWTGGGVTEDTAVDRRRRSRTAPTPSIGINRLASAIAGRLPRASLRDRRSGKILGNIQHPQRRHGHFAKHRRGHRTAIARRAAGGVVQRHRDHDLRIGHRRETQETRVVVCV